MNVASALTEQLFKGADAGANHFSSDAGSTFFGKWVPADYYKMCSAHIVATGIDGATGVVKVQVSGLVTPTDASASDKAGATVTLTAAGHFLVNVPWGALEEKWVRLAYLKGANTVGTIDAYMTLKG